jgi:hypothetical protein
MAQFQVSVTFAMTIRTAYITLGYLCIDLCEGLSCAYHISNRSYLDFSNAMIEI